MTGLHSGNSTSVGFSGTFPRKFSYYLPAFRKFKKFWLNGKRPGSGQKLDVYNCDQKTGKFAFPFRIKLADLCGSLTLSCFFFLVMNTHIFLKSS